MAVASTRALGPYERFAIWVQGCLKSCPGCISPDSQPLDGGFEVDLVKLANEIIGSTTIEGITISGGEPYLQSAPLANLVRQIKTKKDVGVIIYTGYEFSEIKENELTKFCDIIIDGAYFENLNDDLSLRGSSNQNVHILTERYAEVARELYAAPGRKVEMRVRDGLTTLVGIPDKASLKIFDNK